MVVGDAFAFDTVDAGGGDVEQHIDEMVGQQIDFVDVKHPAVRRRKQPGLETEVSLGQRDGQVEGPDQAVLGRPQGEFDEGGIVGQQRREAPGQRRLG